MGLCFPDIVCRRLPGGHVKCIPWICETLHLACRVTVSTSTSEKIAASHLSWIRIFGCINSDIFMDSNRSYTFFLGRFLSNWPYSNTHPCNTEHLKGHSGILRRVVLRYLWTVGIFSHSIFYFVCLVFSASVWRKKLRDPVQKLSWCRWEHFLHSTYIHTEKDLF